jgi:competence protein ComFC
MQTKVRASAVIKAVAPWLKSALDLVYPRNCLFCFQPLPTANGGVICPSCLGKVKVIEPPFCLRCSLPFDGAIKDPFVCGYCHRLDFHFSRAIAACRAEGVVRESIHRFKYNREMYFGPHLAAWLIGAAHRQIDWGQVDAIAPVPLHPRKRRDREFNQADYLARALGREFRVPVCTQVLRRVRDTFTQTALDAKERAANLRNAFESAPAEGIQGKRLVLVDDVFTTGATMDSCARVLTQAGAGDVVALAVARGV